MINSVAGQNGVNLSKSATSNVVKVGESEDKPKLNVKTNLDQNAHNVYDRIAELVPANRWIDFSKNNCRGEVGN